MLLLYYNSVEIKTKLIINQNELFYEQTKNHSA